MRSDHRGSGWQSILYGEQREQARAAVQSIATGILSTLNVGGSKDKLSPHGVSLAGGKAGLAVFYYYLAKSCSHPEKEHYEQASLELLREAVDALNVLPIPASLYGGFTGIAWAVEHLAEIAAGEEDVNEPIDDALIEYLGRSPWRFEYDLVNGLVGYGVYALERMPRASAVECLAQIVDRLDETAIRNSQGVTWHTAPSLLPPWQQTLYPQGYYNLGLSHGVPGVIALLGEICAAEIATAKAKPLLYGAVDWVLSQRLPNGHKATFPAFAGDDFGDDDSRMAWCYGDPGVAAALLGAARCVNEPAWEREAIAIAVHALARPFDQTGVVDAGMCHGAAGLGHIFNRFFQATGELQLKEASQLWFSRTLEMRKAGEGVGDFTFFYPGEGWRSDHCLLTGVAGIGLTLLAAIAPIEPRWDRIFLLSIP